MLKNLSTLNHQPKKDTNLVDHELFSDFILDIDNDAEVIGLPTTTSKPATNLHGQMQNQQQQLLMNQRLEQKNLSGSSITSIETPLVQNSTPFQMPFSVNKNDHFHLVEQAAFDLGLRPQNMDQRHFTVPSFVPTPDLEYAHFLQQQQQKQLGQQQQQQLKFSQQMQRFHSLQEPKKLSPPVAMNDFLGSSFSNLQLPLSLSTTPLSMSHHSNLLDYMKPTQPVYKPQEDRQEKLPSPIKNLKVKVNLDPQTRSRSEPGTSLQTLIENGINPEELQPEVLKRIKNTDSARRSRQKRQEKTKKMLQHYEQIEKEFERMRCELKDLKAKEEQGTKEMKEVKDYCLYLEQVLDKHGVLYEKRTVVGFTNSTN